MKRPRKKLNLTLSIVLLVVAVLCFTMLFIGTLSMVLNQLGYITAGVDGKAAYIAKENHFIGFITSFLLISVSIGGVLSLFLTKKAIAPLQELIQATKQVAEGDFDTKINLKGIAELDSLSSSFNMMTHELHGIETLRNEFVNNFSHEFKTPIVSIHGFARLLKENSLSTEERNEYLDIIINESERLASLSTNILNLSKYENMEIVSEKTSFRLDEQIRQCVLLLEPKWSSHDITMNLELAELTCYANEDLTKQVWLNLLDNAIKFSYSQTAISISLTLEDKDLHFMIQDEGIGMKESTMTHIFDKFYQGDPSHATSGNGLGLPLIRRILNLMDGRIEVESQEFLGSIFHVYLPKSMVSHSIPNKS